MTSWIDRLTHLPVALVHLPSVLRARMLVPSIAFAWGSAFDDPPAMCDGKHDGWFCDECEV